MTALIFFSITLLSKINRPATNIGFAARLAGRWSNGHFIAVVLHLGWTNIVGPCLLSFTFISLISSGSGRTSNEFQPCSKPCPLAVTQMRLYSFISILIISFASSCNYFTKSSHKVGIDDSKKRAAIEFIDEAKPKVSKDIDSIVHKLNDSVSAEFIDIHPDTREIPDLDSSVLVKKLLLNNFSIESQTDTTWSRGPKMTIYFLESKNLFCLVEKLYHSDTTIKGVYRVTERIACLKK